MSDTAKNVKVSLKVMVNKEKTKVLFVEADSDFADVLLSLLTLPLGRIVKLLEKHYAEKSPVFGSITSLYKSLANLDDAYFSTTAAKQMLLDPRSSLDSICRNLKLDISDSEPTKYFFCNRSPCEYLHEQISLYYGNAAIYCRCGSPIDKELIVHDSEDARTASFTSKTASYIICDDLRMMAYTTRFISTLTNLGITCADGAQLMNLTIGSDEIMDLLKCCLFSKTPLSDFILNKGEIISSVPKPEPGFFFHPIEKEESTKNVILRVMVQKSTNKLLFAQAEYDFIELLCTILMIPIGGVESLLDNKTCLNGLHNLRSSISDVGIDKYFITADNKKRLMNPDIPHFYISKNTLLPLHEETAPLLGYNYRYDKFRGPVVIQKFNPADNSTNLVASFKSPKGKNYVKESMTYMVTDDLTVTPFCMSSGFCFLNRLNIPLADVHELEVPIGLQEGLSILKASVSSNSALSNGLMNRIMKKQPKLEYIDYSELLLNTL